MGEKLPSSDELKMLEGFTSRIDFGQKPAPLSLEGTAGEVLKIAAQISDARENVANGPNGVVTLDRAKDQVQALLDGVNATIADLENPDA